MNLKEIKALYRFLRNTDIVEFEAEDEQGRIVIKRGEPGVVSKGAVAQAEAAAPAAASKETEDKAEQAAQSKNIKTVTSPMVGTFYSAPSPDAEAYVEVGSRVKKGQTLCIIEAMKLMNEVESEYDGVITSILVENGQPVEYGEPLFYIEVA
jgi:acetyl-CoA carboxylase biotin carboxyl carrier protein